MQGPRPLRGPLLAPFEWPLCVATYIALRISRSARSCVRFSREREDIRTTRCAIMGGTCTPLDARKADHPRHVERERRKAVNRKSGHGRLVVALAFRRSAGVGGDGARHPPQRAEVSPARSSNGVHTVRLPRKGALDGAIGGQLQCARRWRLDRAARAPK